MTRYPIPAHYGYRFTVDGDRIYEIKDWLAERDLDFGLMFAPSDEIVVCLADKDAATLFKLTWFGA